MTKSRAWIAMVVVGSALSTARAVDPPSTLNYQGVLRDAADKPQAGIYAMVFRFFDAASGGAEILVDTHSGGNAISVINGVFNVALGSGSVADG